MFSPHPVAHQETQPRADGESSQETPLEHRHEPSPEPTLQLSTHSAARQETQQRVDGESSQGTTQEYRHEPNVEPTSQPHPQPHPEPTVGSEEAPRVGGRRYYFGPDSDESEDDYEFELNSHDSEEDSEDEKSSSSSESSRASYERPRRFATHCTLYDVRTYVPRRVRDYGPHSPQQKEWENLNQGSLGTQFWLSMFGNPAGGPAKYMPAGAYVRYGFVIWEEQRMIHFGLWSHHALDNISEYYRRWYAFLSPQEVGHWEQKFYIDVVDSE